MTSPEKHHREHRRKIPGKREVSKGLGMFRARKIVDTMKAQNAKKKPKGYNKEMPGGKSCTGTPISSN